MRASPFAHTACAAALVAANVWFGRYRNDRSSIASVSRTNPTPITPAPYTFGIWGLIYAGVAVYVVGHWLYPDMCADAVSNALFICGCVLNVLWIVLFTKGAEWNLPRWRSVCAVALGALSVVVHAHAIVLGANIDRLLRVGADNDVIRQAFVWTPVLTYTVYAAWTLVAVAINVWIAASRSSDAIDTEESITRRQMWVGVTLATLVFVACVVLRFVRAGSFTWPVRVTYISVLVWAAVGVLVRRRGIDDAQQSV